jgi:hypothetical protein
VSISVLEAALTASRQSSGWSPHFRNSTGRLGPMSKTGIAEIKPHKDAQIRKGLYQLRNYLFQMRHPRPRRVGSAWLLTYLPGPVTGSSSHAGPTIQVIAHRINRRLLLPDSIRTPQALRSAPPPPGLAALTEFRATLRPLQLPKVLPSTMPFPTLAQPDMFGLAVEDPIRKQFREHFGITVLKMAVTRADVQWELAQLYGELARATGDSYWRDVANELSSSEP